MDRDHPTNRQCLDNRKELRDAFTKVMDPIIALIKLHTARLDTLERRLDLIERGMPELGTLLQAMAKVADKKLADLAKRIGRLELAAKV